MNQNYYFKKIILFIVVILVFSREALADDWNFVFAPYGQLPSISGDASVSRIEGANLDVGAEDILEYLSLGAMVQVEAHHKSGLGFILNYGFMNLEDSLSGPKGFTDFDGEVFQGVLEGFISYRNALEIGTLDIYAGFRWWEMDIDVSAQNQLGKIDLSRGANWVDPVIGTRFVPTITENWSAYLQTDVGGFGAASDSSFRLSAGFLNDLSDCFTLALLYQAIWVDYSEGNIGDQNRFLYDTVTHGPLIGLAYKF